MQSGRGSLTTQEEGEEINLLDLGTRACPCTHVLREERERINNFNVLVVCGGGGPRSVMAKTPDSHAGGPGFKSRCRPTNFGSHLPYTPPPGRKDASRVPKGMVYAKAEHPG